MSDDTQKGPAQKHITTACTSCRRRKVKCDGASPSCSNCKLYRQVCEYNRGEDRRKVSKKKHIDALNRRIQLLEGLLRLHGISFPVDENDRTPPNETGARSTISNNSLAQQTSPSDSQDAQESLHESALINTDTKAAAFSNSHNDFDMDFSGGHASQQDLALPWNAFMTDHDQTQILQPTMPFSNEFGDAISDGPWQSNDAATNLDFSYKDLANIVLPSVNDRSHENINPDSVHAHRRVSTAKPRTQSFIEWHDDNSWSNQENGPKRPALEVQGSDEMIDQLSARMGSFQIAEDGQLRYFGATSNLHILHNGVSSLSRTPTRSVRTEGALALERAGLAQEVDPDFEQHLEKLYFTWEDPAIHVVDKEMYYQEKEKYEDGEDGISYYSETLKNAICAIGANLTPRSRQGLPEPVPEFFSHRAKTLLDIEMDSPSVATVQALVIMSASEAAFTRDARGWIYSGMAVRISADLGLHLDLSSHVQTGKLTQHELDVRRTTFWGVFVHDNMWSLYVGRPWGINIRDISISRPPTEFDKIKNKSWKSYYDHIGVPASVANPPALFDPVEACADSNISLCTMMRRLSRILYSGRDLTDEELRSFASDMRREFSEWHESLPAELTVNMAESGRQYLPHVLQLHMQFHAISIFLHRPFFSRNVGDREVSAQAQRTCVEAAQAMVNLLRIYRNQHTLRQTNVQIVHLLFTASLIHIYNTCSSFGKAAESAMADLQFCCQALGEIGVAYKNSTRALEVIICIKQEWQMKASALKMKRRSSHMGLEGEESTQRKRRATDDKHFERPSIPQPEVHDGTDGMWEYAQHSTNGINMADMTRDVYPMLGTISDDTFGYEYLNNQTVIGSQPNGSNGRTG